MSAVTSSPFFASSLMLFWSMTPIEAMGLSTATR
jgi:hypothetical protein